MATPRKHWFRVADSILRDIPKPEHRGIAVGLMSWLNQRWARDGLSGEQACRALLTRGALVDITGRTQLGHARSALSVLSQYTEISIQSQGELTEIYWPNFAKFQRLESYSGDKHSLESPPPRRKTQDAPARHSSESSLDRDAPPKQTERDKAPPEAIQFAEDFREALQAFAQQQDRSWKPPNESSFERWIKSARLMLQADKRPLAEAQAIAQWLFSGTDSDADFWRGNVECVPTFRKRYDKLAVKWRMNQQPRSKRNGKPTIRDAIENIAADYGPARADPDIHQAGFDFSYGLERGS